MRLSRNMSLRVRNKFTKIHIIIVSMLVASLLTGMFYGIKPIGALTAADLSQANLCGEGGGDECGELMITSLAFKESFIGASPGFTINTPYLAAKDISEVTVLFGGVEGEVQEVRTDLAEGKDHRAGIFVVAPLMSHLTENTIVDITVIDHVSNESFTLYDAFTFLLPVPLEIDDVAFHEQDGEKMMLITTIGDPIFEGIEDIYYSGAYAILNGTPLGLCAFDLGMTAQEIIDMTLENGGPDMTGHVTDHKPCYSISPPPDIGQQAHVYIKLDDDFDIGAPGTISVLKSPVFAFNQPEGGDTDDESDDDDVPTDPANPDDSPAPGDDADTEDIDSETPPDSTTGDGTLADTGQATLAVAALALGLLASGVVVLRKIA